MDRIAWLRKMFAYERWANVETLASLERAGSPPSKAVRVFAHILGASSLWYARADGKPAADPVWPEWDLAESREKGRAIEESWSAELVRLSPDGLTRTVTYKNSLGEPWTSEMDDVLTHLLLHGAYHRGQIASELRNAGHEPAYTDYIHAVRHGYLREAKG